MCQVSPGKAHMNSLSCRNALRAGHLVRAKNWFHDLFCKLGLIQLQQMVWPFAVSNRIYTCGTHNFMKKLYYF